MKIIDWIQELPIEAKEKVYGYLKDFPKNDTTLDFLNEEVSTLEIAVARCLPYEECLNEPFEYWYNITR